MCTVVSTLQEDKPAFGILIPVINWNHLVFVSRCDCSFYSFSAQHLNMFWESCWDVMYNEYNKIHLQLVNVHFTVAILTHFCSFHMELGIKWTLLLLPCVYSNANWLRDCSMCVTRSITTSLPWTQIPLSYIKQYKLQAFCKKKMNRHGVFTKLYLPFGEFSCSFFVQWMLQIFDGKPAGQKWGKKVSITEMARID